MISQLSLRIKQLRKERRKTLKQVADAIGCSEAYLSKIERDTRQPSRELTLSIADYFGVTVDYLLGKTQEKELREKRNLGEFEELLNEMTLQEREQALERLKEYLTYKRSSQSIR